MVLEQHMTPSHTPPHCPALVGALPGDTGGEMTGWENKQDKMKLCQHYLCKTCCRLHVTEIGSRHFGHYTKLGHHIALQSYLSKILQSLKQLGTYQYS